MTGQQVWIAPPALVGIDPVELLLDGGEDTNAVSRRVSRVATLDGGVAIYDGGYSIADREFSWRVRTDSDTADTVLGWVTTQPILHMTMRDLALAVVPRAGRYQGDVLTISFYVQSDLRS